MALDAPGPSSPGPTEVIVPESIIASHRFENGLVLVAETLPTVRSAAFTFLLPAGAAFEPADRGGRPGCSPSGSRGVQGTWTVAS